MSIELEDVKVALRVVHDADDAYLERLIESAIREYARYINQDSTSSDFFVGEDAFNGIVLMVRADYEVEPDKREAVRLAAEVLWQPYRTGLGV